MRCHWKAAISSHLHSPDWYICPLYRDYFFCLYDVFAVCYGRQLTTNDTTSGCKIIGFHLRDHVLGTGYTSLASPEMDMDCTGLPVCHETCLFVSIKTSKAWQPHVESQRDAAFSQTVVRHRATRCTAATRRAFYILLAPFKWNLNIYLYVIRYILQFSFVETLGRIFQFQALCTSRFFPINIKNKLK